MPKLPDIRRNYSSSPAVFFLLAACAMSFPAGCRRPTPQVQPGRVVGGSMAEHFWGEHWQVTCGDCGYPFRCGTEYLPSNELVICPNCGFAKNSVADLPIQPGLAVDVVPRDFTKDPPRRWEVLAVRDPSQPGRVAIKRVVGLPGEKIAIRHGDIYANGLIVRKTLAELREVMQPVHDDRFVAKTPDAAPRWHSLVSRREGHRYLSTEDSKRKSLGLGYRHLNSPQTRLLKAHKFPVRDDSGYQAELSRELHIVPDLVVTFRAKMGGKWGSLLATLESMGRLSTTVRCDANNGITLYRRHERVLDPVKYPHDDAQHTYEFALCDSQVLMAIDGENFIAYPYKPTDEVGLHQGFPCDLHMRGEEVEISNLQIFRDIHYLNPINRTDDWEAEKPLAADEIFLLGDSPFASTDSRTWGPVKIEAIVGSVNMKQEKPQPVED